MIRALALGLAWAGLVSASPSPQVDDALILSDALPPRLQDFGLLVDGKTPAPGVVPYHLNTPLFSDYADKFRFMHLPKGKKAKATGDGLLDFPVGTVLISINAVVFNLLPNPGYDAYLLYVVALAFVSVLGLVKYQLLYYAVVNFCLLMLVVMLAYFATQTGHIQSSALVWMCILSIPALFFLGQLGGLVWLLVILTIITGLYALTLHSPANPLPNNAASVLYATANHVMAVASLMLMVRLYDQITEKQRTETEARNQDLVQVHADMRVAQAHKDEFVAAMGHELRTPMTSIRMLIDTLVADPDLQPDRTRAYLEVVSRETLRLGRLVDDYLTFARLERGGMNYDFQPTAPETVVEAAVRSVESRFAAPGCDFRTEIARELPLIQADAPSLTTALLNLLENAHKYTGADKRILLTVTRSGSTLCFAVTDNGRGFDPRQRSRIFEKFYRAEGPGSPVTGAGLGLHIVKSIVEAHGGQVEVETTPGEGSRFAIHIPVVAANTERHLET